MKEISKYIQEALHINEAIKHLPAGVSGLIVFDIDDTLLKSDPNDIKVWKKEPGKEEVALSTEEFAKDPDAADKSKQNWFDYREFDDPEKVYQSIINGTPMIKNLKIMDSYLHAGYDFCFLTARGCEDVVKQALDDFIEVKDRETGVMKKLGERFKKTLSHAINDLEKRYPGKTDGERKSNVLRDLCSKYDNVVFVDDDDKNIKAAKALELKNLKIIKAW